MSTHPYLSNYLVTTPQSAPAPSWHRWVRLAIGQRPRPSVSPRVVLGIGSWLVLIGAIVFVSTHLSLAVPPRLAAAGQGSRLTQMRLTSAVKAPELPSGPSGQLLPPGTMAAPYTYANSYVHGQCTWYVAGRRPIPNGWGNAVSWYAHARSAGWSVGTTPAIAAIAWTPNGYYGHVALVEAIEGNEVLISEMNYLGSYKIDRRWIPVTSVKYIY